MRKFEKIIKDYGLIEEAEFVRGNEGSELPDDNESPEDMESPEVPDSEEVPQDNEDPSEVYTNRERNLLEVALKIYLTNKDIDLETRNELDTLFNKDEWGQLHKRLISIVDGLDIA